jgi:hypothetical protein
VSTFSGRAIEPEQPRPSLGDSHGRVDRAHVAGVDLVRKCREQVIQAGELEHSETRSGNSPIAVVVMLRSSIERTLPSRSEWV